MSLRCLRSVDKYRVPRECDTRLVASKYDASKVVAPLPGLRARGCPLVGPLPGLR